MAVGIAFSSVRVERFIATWYDVLKLYTRLRDTMDVKLSMVTDFRVRGVLDILLKIQ